MSQSQVCSICQQQPEDLLILSCQHNLCVSCATEVYRINQEPNLFICEICLSETSLDTQTIEYLDSLAKQQPVTEKKKLPVSNPRKSRMKSSRIDKNLCDLHKEPSMYFCFDCQTSKICSQCILTTKHAKHRVYTLKKAMGMMQKKVHEQIRSKQNLKDQLYCEKNKFVEAKQQLTAEIEQYREDIKEIFDEIVRVVSEKYAEICAELEEAMQRKQELIEGSILEIDDKITMIEETLKLEKQIHKSKNQTDFIAYYSQIHHNNDIFLPQLPSEFPQIDLNLLHHQGAVFDVKKILDRICWSKNEKYHEESLPCSVIEREYIMQEPPKTVLKESHHVSNSRVCSSKQSNRKLQLSRSLDNATNIINKLQERSRKV